MAYVIDDNPQATRDAAAWLNFLRAEKDALIQFGPYLDNIWNGFWFPQGSDPTFINAKCGNTVLARFMLFDAMAREIIAQELANGIDPLQHPWAARDDQGNITPIIRPGWSYTPILDETTGQPTGGVDLHAPAESNKD